MHVYGVINFHCAGVTSRGHARVEPMLLDLKGEPRIAPKESEMEWKVAFDTEGATEEADVPHP